MPQLPVETLDQSTDSSSSLSEEAFSFCPSMYFNIISSFAWINIIGWICFQ
jgi:hypothetical protein